MARGAITSEGSSGENIHHFSTIRLRATGQGKLSMVVHSMDLVRSKQLAMMQLEGKTRIQPNRIVNFVEQRACFEFQLTDIDEYFRINRIIVFMKEIYTSHPGA